MKAKLPPHLTLILIISFFFGSVVQPSLAAPPTSEEPFSVAEASEKGQQVAPGETPEGLTTPEWNSIRQAIRDAEYHFAYHEATDEIPDPYYWAPNRSQGWETIFRPQGIEVSSDVKSRVARRCRWKLTAKRWVSSRIILTSRITGEVFSRKIGSSSLPLKSRWLISS